MTSAPL